MIISLKLFCHGNHSCGGFMLFKQFCRGPCNNHYAKFIKAGPVVSEQMSFEEIVDASRRTTHNGQCTSSIRQSQTAHIEHKVLR